MNYALVYIPTGEVLRPLLTVLPEGSHIPFGFNLVNETDLPVGWKYLVLDKTPEEKAEIEKQIKAFKDNLLADFAVLPVTVRAAFRSVKTQVLDCINDGAYDEAVYLIFNLDISSYPASLGLAQVKQALLAKFMS